MASWRLNLFNVAAGKTDAHQVTQHDEATAAQESPQFRPGQGKAADGQGDPGAQ